MNPPRPATPAPAPATAPSPAPARPAVLPAPSMMCADFLALGAELDCLAAHGVRLLHQDVMDGCFVPNLALGADLCRAMASRGDFAHDVHLMVGSPEDFVEKFATLPGARIAFHPETTRHPVALIERIRALGATPAVAVSPQVPVRSLEHLLPLVGQVTVMTVTPGFAGQRLLPWCLPKIAETRAWADAHNPALDIAADGNVSWENIPAILAAGANVLVLGTSSLFSKTLSRTEAFARLASILPIPYKRPA
jgi:ribulose-phosphate 3-epimerase